MTRDVLIYIIITLSDLLRPKQRLQISVQFFVLAPMSLFPIPWMYQRINPPNIRNA